MRYFAGANSRKGFVSLFDEAFSDCQRLYILKGSSGCGKSTLMKKVAEKAKENGFDTDYIHCSADSDSLDGVIIPKLGIAIADGTSPHILDVKYPCVRETIINLGEFWDEAKLIPRKSEIISLTDRKSQCYKNAYKSLYAAGNAFDIASEIINKCIFTDKLHNYAFRIMDKIEGSKKGNRKQIFATSFSCDGFSSLKVFDKIDVLYRISGKGANIMLSALERIAIEENRDCILAYSPIDPKSIEAIYFPDQNILITTLSCRIFESVNSVKSFSTSRFIDNEKLSNFKVRLGGIEKLCQELLQEAKNDLAEAKRLHNQIEDIFIPAMDFDSMSLYTDKLIANIFKS